MTEVAHYAVLSVPMWGHCRPELCLTLRLFQLHPHLLITLFLPSIHSKRTADELDAFRLTDEERARLKVVYYDLTDPMPAKPEGEEDSDWWKRVCEWMGKPILSAYESLLKGEIKSDEPYTTPHIQEPDIILCDVFAMFGILPLLPKIYGSHPLPRVLGLCPLSTAFMAGMTELGGSFQVALSSYLEMKRGGASDADAFKQSIIESEAIFSPDLGVAPMYLKEANPNNSSRLSMHMSCYKQFAEMIEPHDLIVIWPSPSAFDSTGPTLSKYLFVGPQQAPSQPTGYGQRADDVMSFLDASPPRTVLYLCFGTNVWPPDAAQTRILFESILSAGLRTLIVQSGVVDLKIPEDVKAELEKGKEKLGARAMTSIWVPQNQVLSHPAITGFLTHCGSNSAMEGMLNGVPMIGWPGAWDQSFIASQLDSLGIGVELVQVRTGHNIGRKTARGVLVTGTDEAIRDEMEQAFKSITGSEGEAMRARVAAVRMRVLEDMQTGEARKAMETLGHLL